MACFFSRLNSFQGFFYLWCRVKHKAAYRYGHLDDWLTVHSFLTGAHDSHLQRVTIPEAAYIQLRRRPPEDEQGNARNM